MFVYFQSAFLWNWAEILVCWIFVKLGICMHIPMENSENEFAIQKKATLRYFFLKSLLVACFPKTWNFGPLVIASQMALWIYIHILSILRLVRSPTTSQLSDLWWSQARWQLRELLRLLDPTFNLDHDWPHRRDLVCIKNIIPCFLDFLCSTGSATSGMPGPGGWGPGSHLRMGPGHMRWASLRSLVWQTKVLILMCFRGPPPYGPRPPRSPLMRGPFPPGMRSTSLLMISYYVSNSIIIGHSWPWT